MSSHGNWSDIDFGKHTKKSDKNKKGKRLPLQEEIGKKLDELQERRMRSNLTEIFK